MPRHEGAWGADWGCWGLLGSQDGCARVPTEAKKAPNTPPKNTTNEPRTWKSRSIGLVDRLEALKEPPAARKEFPNSFLGVKMRLKETQKTSTEALKSSANDIQIKNVKVHKTNEKSIKCFVLWGSEGQLGAQICIAKAFGI